MHRSWFPQCWSSSSVCCGLALLHGLQMSGGSQLFSLVLRAYAATSILCIYAFILRGNNLSAIPHHAECLCWCFITPYTLSCVVLGLALSLLRSISIQALGSILFSPLFHCLSQPEEPVAWIVQFILIAFSEEMSVQLTAELEHTSAFSPPLIAQRPLL